MQLHSIYSKPESSQFPNPHNIACRERRVLDAEGKLGYVQKTEVKNALFEIIRANGEVLILPAHTHMVYHNGQMTLPCSFRALRTHHGAILCKAFTPESQAA